MLWYNAKWQNLVCIIYVGRCYCYYFYIMTKKGKWSQCQLAMQTILKNIQFFLQTKWPYKQFPRILIIPITSQAQSFPLICTKGFRRGTRAVYIFEQCNNFKSAIYIKNEISRVVNNYRMPRSTIFPGQISMKI